MTRRDRRAAAAQARRAKRRGCANLPSPAALLDWGTRCRLAGEELQVHAARAPHSTAWGRQVRELRGLLEEGGAALVRVADHADRAVLINQGGTTGSMVDERAYRLAVAAWAAYERVRARNSRRYQEVLDQLCREATARLPAAGSA